MWKQKAVSGSRQENQLGSYLVGLKCLLLASAWACNEALHLSSWSGAGQAEGGGELVPGLLFPARSGC